MDYRGRHDKHVALFLLLALYATVVLRNAWVGDDAYISFRTIDNFVNGFGLTWNTAERVQAFTHPLWVFLLIPFYAITGEIYFTTLVISLILSVSALTIYGYKISCNWSYAVLGILVLTLSDAFVDYSASGLENPLTFFLLAVFMLFYLKREHNRRTLFLLCFVAALAAVNRQDSILLYVPMLIYVFWKVRGRKAVLTVLGGFLPLVLWEVFSFLYYGFPVPNTAYAKLSAGLSLSVLFDQGFCYLLNSFNIDPITILIIAGGLSVPIVAREHKLAPASIGILFTLLYILRIGGCFMSGRHFAAPLFLSVILLAQFQDRLGKRGAGAAFVVILTLGLTQEFSPVRTQYYQKQNHEPVHLQNGITDERKYYSPNTGLMNYQCKADSWPADTWVNSRLREQAGEEKVIVYGNIGFLGYYAGPDVFIIDLYGLSDPLLSRLPMGNAEGSRIGHYHRRIPRGYEESIRQDTNVIRDPHLALYYDKLALITRGSIFDFDRLIEIVKFNLGYYDHLLSAYVNSDLITVRHSDICERKADSSDWRAPGNVVITTRCLQVNFEAITYSRQIDISYDNNDDYHIVFLADEEERGEYTIHGGLIQAQGLLHTVVPVPADAVEKGYDRIRIYPEKGDGRYSIGHVILLDN